MAIKEQFKTWYSNLQKYKVRYKDGFFHLTNLANSPRTIIENFDKVKFIKHWSEKKMMQSQTFFFNVKTHYAELDEGLCIMVSEFKFKKNIVIHNLFDSTLPIKHNVINLHNSQKLVKSKTMVINGMLLTDKTWLVFKAGIVKDSYHFKDSEEFNITIFFTDEWFNKNYKTISRFKNSNFDKFLNSDNQYLLHQETNYNSESDVLYEKFLDLIKKNVTGKKNKEITNLTLNLFDQFTTLYDKEPINDNHFKLSDKDRKQIKKVEKILNDSLTTIFPGIDALSGKIGISATKLKNDFKVVHNKSLYQYYRSHKMQLAEQILAKKANTVKEVASLLGYENASKFSAVFKEQFGVQPSSILK